MWKLHHIRPSLKVWYFTFAILEACKWEYIIGSLIMILCYSTGRRKLSLPGTVYFPQVVPHDAHFWGLLFVWFFWGGIHNIFHSKGLITFSYDTECIQLILKCGNGNTYMLQVTKLCRMNISLQTNHSFLAMSLHSFTFRVAQVYHLNVAAWWQQTPNGDFHR